MNPHDIQKKRLASLGRLLGLAFRVFEARVIRSVRAGGHPDVRPAHAALTRSMSLEGTRISILAERAGVTKQAMGQLVQQMKAMGYVKTATDPSDRRAKLVSYTAKGKRLVEAIVRAAEDVERSYAEAMGVRRTKEMRATLGRLLDEVFPEHESFWSTPASVRSSPEHSRGGTRT